MKVTCFPGSRQRFSDPGALWEWHFKVIVRSDLKCVELREPVEKDCPFGILYVSGPKRLGGGQKKGNLYATVDPSYWTNPSPRGPNEDGGPLVYIVRLLFRASTYGKFVRAVEFTATCGLKKSCQVRADVTQVDAAVECGIVTQMIEKGSIPKVDYDLLPLAPLSSPAESPRLLEVNDRKLLERYVLLGHAIATFSAAFGKDLAQYDYDRQLKIFLHTFLFIEEAVQVKLAMKFACFSDLHFSSSVGVESMFQVATTGDLLAIVELERDLEGDSPEAQVMMGSVSTAKLELRMEDGTERVVDALVEEKHRRNVLVRIGAACARINGLRDGQTVRRAFCSFLPNRLPFCERHYAVDEFDHFPLDAGSINALLTGSNVLMPDVGELNCGLSLDEHQERAMSAVFAPSNVVMPPIIVQGPYGTGKTHTVGACCLEVLSRLQSARVLICTQSNSAADHYLDRFFCLPEGATDRLKFPRPRPFRIYYTGRKLASIDSRYHGFCNINREGGFLYRPTLAEVVDSRVVITTCATARMLRDIGVPKGSFSHIFIDEAGQSLVSEALIPLTLCGPGTRVVLAGDPKQMCSRVYCSFALSYGFHLSLLEFFSRVYPEDHPCHVVLRSQHRSDLDLFSVISRTFYPDDQMEASEQPVSFLPSPSTSLSTEVRFYHVGSPHKVDNMDGSCINVPEIAVAVQVVQLLVGEDESGGGDSNEKSVAVITAHRAQIQMTRVHLRKIGLGHVVVDSVANIQGREFQHIVLMTCRSFASSPRDGVGTGSGSLSWIQDVESTPEAETQATLTACTRAKSTVTLIGNAVYLCLTNHTGKMWKSIIEYCNERKSLLGIDLATLENELEVYERIRRYKLNIKAEEFYPSQDASGAVSDFLSPNAEHIGVRGGDGHYPYGPPGLTQSVDMDPLQELNMHLQDMRLEEQDTKGAPAVDGHPQQVQEQALQHQDQANDAASEEELETVVKDKKSFFTISLVNQGSKAAAVVDDSGYNSLESRRTEGQERVSSTNGGTVPGTTAGEKDVVPATSIAPSLPNPAFDYNCPGCISLGVPGPAAGPAPLPPANRALSQRPIGYPFLPSVIAVPVPVPIPVLPHPSSATSSSSRGPRPGTYASPPMYAPNPFLMAQRTILGPQGGYNMTQAMAGGGHTHVANGGGYGPGGYPAAGAPVYGSPRPTPWDPFMFHQFMTQMRFNAMAAASSQHHQQQYGRPTPSTTLHQGASLPNQTWPPQDGYSCVPAPAVAATLAPAAHQDGGQGHTQEQRASSADFPPLPSRPGPGKG